MIDVTTQQLGKTEQVAFFALSVFPPKPNSFSEDAALAVAGCAVETLDQLSDSGLLETSGSDRYTLHQTIADYARLHLHDESAYQRLIDCMTTLVETHRKDYGLLESERSNILAALELASELARASQLVRLACALAPFLFSRGLYQLAETSLQRAFAAARARSDHHGVASTLRYLGEIAQKQSQYEQASHAFQEGLQSTQQEEDHELRADLLAHLGRICWRQGKYPQAEEYLQEGLALARELGFQEQRCASLQVLGSVKHSEGKYTQAEGYWWPPAR